MVVSVMVGTESQARTALESRSRFTSSRYQHVEARVRHRVNVAVVAFGGVARSGLVS